MGLRNLPTDRPEKLSGLITCHPGQVSSMALTSLGDATSMTLLAFSAGEGVSEEVYEGDTLYLLAEGQACVTLPEGPVNLRAGEALMVPRGVPHAIGNTGAFKVLQITVP